MSSSKTWLELGNKQRATAATGMNDKSSRSHSVFTLVMTQTKVRPLDLFGYICPIEVRCYFYFNQQIKSLLMHLRWFCSYDVVCMCTDWVCGGRGARSLHHQPDKSGRFGRKWALYFSPDQWRPAQGNPASNSSVYSVSWLPIMHSVAYYSVHVNRGICICSENDRIMILYEIMQCIMKS